MLVYCKTPGGIMDLNGYRIYGKMLGRKPTDIPFEVYKHCKHMLRDATYREESLTNIFGEQFPEIAFTYKELRYLPEDVLDVIGRLIVLCYSSNWSRKRKVDQIKRRFADVSPGV